MANDCDGTIEFLFKNRRDAEKMRSDFEGVMGLDSPDSREGYFFAQTYFPDICDSIDRRCFICHMTHVLRLGDKYQFSMFTDDAWCSKIGLWTGICKKYYPKAEVHYTEYEPGGDVYCKWDPDGSLEKEKYHLEVGGDDIALSENVDSVEDIKELTCGKYDGLYKEGDTPETFVERIETSLENRWPTYIHLYEWEECPPEKFYFLEKPDGSVTVEDFDFDSVRKVDIDALIKGGPSK